MLLIAPMAAIAQGPEDTTDPLTFVKKGMTQNAKGDFTAALDSFNHALELDPHDSEAFEGRGESHLGQGDLTDAVSDFSQALKIEPQSEPALLHRGRAESSQGNFDAALADLSQALGLVDLAPADKPLLFFERGRAKYFKGDDAGAMEDLGQAGASQANFGDAAFFSGLAALDAGQTDQAAADFAKAASLGKPEAALWWWDAKMEGHHNDDANAGLTSLLNSAHPTPWLSELGNLLLQRTTDVQVTADALNGRPDENRLPEAWFFVGLSRELSGDSAGAKQAYTKPALTTGAPDSPLIFEAQRHLKKLSP